MKIFSLKLCFLLKRACLLFLLISLFGMAFSQSLSIVKNVTLKPPYSSNYSTYENLSNHAIITLLGSTESMNIVLHGSLTNVQRDFRIVTKETYLGGMFSLGANQTKVMISDFASMLFLGRNNVEHIGIPDEEWLQVLKTGQLPEGSYEFCVNAFWADPSGLLVPAGEACFSFSISLAQAPVITSPYNGQNLNPQLPNTVFAWTPPIGNTIGASIVYDLYVVKVPIQQDPNEVMNAAVNFKANNPLVITNLSSNQYVTQPYDLKIDSSSLYAVQVIARDINKQVGFMNNGRSEVVTFTKGKFGNSNIIITEIKQPVKKPLKPSPGYVVSNLDPVPMSELKGILYYRFKDDLSSKTTIQSSQVSNQDISMQANTQMYGGGTPDNMLYNKDNTSLGDAKPLAGKKISLVVTYIFSGNLGGKNVTEEPIVPNNMYMPKKDIAGADQVLATTTTGSDGSFMFSFINAEKTLGLLKGDYAFSTSGEFGYKVNGKLFKVFRIRIEDKYYCSPDVNIKIDPWKGIDLGKLISYVKSYTLKIKITSTTAKFWDMAQGQGSPLPGVAATILRKNVIVSVPKDEGEKNSQGGVLATHESGKDGFVTFHHLVRHDPNNKSDRYYIKCTPDKMKGDFVFKVKEESYYPLFNSELSGFPFNSASTYNPPPVQGGFNIPITYGEDIIWNHQLDIKTYLDSIALYPAAPRIAGKVEVAEKVDAKAMSDIKVVMINKYKNPTEPTKLFTTVKTNENGRYEFNNLPVETGEFKVGMVTSVIGPTRTLITKPNGFKSGILPAKPPYPPLKWGQQLLNQDFSISPDGLLKGYVEDENGNPVEADIEVEGYTKTTTKLQFTYKKSATTTYKKLPAKAKGQQYVIVNPGKPDSKNAVNMVIPTGTRQFFSMKAPSGDRKLTITPTDNAFDKKDTLLVIKKEEIKSKEIKFVVLRSQKRIRFQVAEQPPGSKGRLHIIGSSSSKVIAGAIVKLDIPGETITQTSDKDGIVTFIFDNSAANFDFIITPPADADYETGYYTLTGVKNTTQIVTYGNAYLKNAATITGRVTTGQDSKPLNDAKVYIEIGNGKKIETTTGTDGKYILKGVPASPVEKIVWAGKAGAIPNILSQNKSITLGIKNELDFNLVNDNELLIETIFGFDADVQSKVKQSDGTWLVSGSLINLPANENFSLQDNKQSLPFQNLKIKKSGASKNGISIGVPADNILSTDLANIKLLLHHSFGVLQQPVKGDQLQVKVENNKGKLMGIMAIQKSSFKFTQNYVTFNDDPDKAMLVTDSPGSYNTDISSIEIGTATKKKFGLANLQGKALDFTLLGFNAEVDAAKSWIQDKDINLATIIYVNSLPGMSPSSIALQAGNLIIHPEKLEPLKGNQPIKFNLEKWQFIGNNWQLSQNSSSINIATGTIKTGTIDVPLSDIELRPNQLDIGDYEVNNLTLGGLIPVQVTAVNPIFGYNKSIGSDQKAHYELRLIGDNSMPAVIIKSLPGMKPNDEMKFQKFSLVSNGEQFINPGNQTNNLTFYNIMKVKPLSFMSGPDYVNMTCGIDLEIPQLQETSGVIQFTKKGGQVKLMLYPLNVSLKGPGDVDFTANVQFNDHPQNLSEGKFTALGTIHDKEGIVLKGVLNKTINAAWIQVDPENQKLPLGGSNSSLANIKGKMVANMGEGLWNNFIFSGEMQGFKGMQGDTRKTFIVTGSINANNEKIEVKNIPSGFGNIGLTYDIANSRFTGNLQLDKTMGPLSIAGTANLLVDPGGWYFLAGGKVQSPGLGQFSAGLLLGDYNSMPAGVSTSLMQYAYDKNVPPSFKNGISGFFFTGMKELPVLNIPNYSIDLGVISASFGAQAGLDARLWMDFASGGNEYGIGAMVFAHAYLKGASITCVKFGADARAELGLKGKYVTSTGAFSLVGCGSFTISGSIQQCFPSPCWSDGICCEGCIGISKSTGIKVDFTLDSNGSTDLSFGFGNCSGQATMSGNW